MDQTLCLGGKGMNVAEPQASRSRSCGFNEVVTVCYEETELLSHSVCCL